MLITGLTILLTSFLLVCYSIKKIIYISYKKHLFDEPSEDRKVHVKRTPNLGGVAIFASIYLTCAVFLPDQLVPNMKYLVAAGVIVFFLGLTDDLVGVDPLKKFLTQIAVALLITVPGLFRVENLGGCFGIYHLPAAVSISLSTLFIIFVMNAFNLIDGINCLAGGIGLLASICFAALFFHSGDNGFFLLSVGLSGCLAAFLLFNKTPARIFMGDTGALFLGLLFSIFSIRLMNSGHDSKSITHAPTLVFGILSVPLFDTLRVFFLRLSTKRSPFIADRNHIHHRLIDLQLSHMQASGILVLLSASTFGLSILLQKATMAISIGAIVFFLLMFNGFVSLIAAKRKSRKHQSMPIETPSRTFQYQRKKRELAQF